MRTHQTGIEIGPVEGNENHFENIGENAIYLNRRRINIINQFAMQEGKK